MKLIIIELPNEVSDDAVQVAFDACWSIAKASCAATPLAPPQVRVGRIHSSL
jgi:hypothetical protein